jgi:putative membrane protein
MKTFLSRSLIATLLAVITGVALPSAKADDSSLSGKDKSFIQDAYQDGLAEVDVAQLAQRKTGNADVKAFAEKLATDHSASNTELKVLAESKKVSTASEPSMVAKGKSKLMDAKTGADFDKAYIDAMITDHKKDIEAFEKAANEGKDQDVKNFASKTLPTLKEHLSAAESIQAKIGK